MLRRKSPWQIGDAEEEVPRQIGDAEEEVACSHQDIDDAEEGIGPK